MKSRIHARRPRRLPIVYKSEVLSNGNQFHISTGFVSDESDGKRWIVGDKNTSVSPNKFKSYDAALAFLVEKENSND